MQLKGLVRFFTILLILVSVYSLSFSWVVRGHERKMESKAKQFVSRNYADADQATKDSVYKARLKALLDSTSEETVHYGLTGPISYSEAKKLELNLGLDLKGGINVSLEVEMSGLIQTLANNPRDPSLVKALAAANERKANSGADFITLFVEEYRKIKPDGRLAALFGTSSGKIKNTDSDDKVISELRSASYEAFDNTFSILKNRIDQFGVAQPNVNPDRERGVITVELPGIQEENPERVRSMLQASAFLEFWEVYKDEETAPWWAAADAAYNALVGGGDTATVPRTLTGDFFKQDREAVGIPIKDTATFRKFLEEPSIRQAFSPDARFVFGIPPRDQNNKKAKVVPVYILRTKGQTKAPLEGDAIVSASQGFQQFSSKPNVNMELNALGSAKWERLTATSHDEKRPIAIVLDNVVYSAPVAWNGKITGGRTEISGNFTVQEAQDLAAILQHGRLPAPAKIVAENIVGPTLGEKAVQGGFLSFVISFIVIFLLMLVYYNTSGWVANIALILNLLFTIGILTALGATLTAPGIAGLVLTIGMAVDTNVIIYERIKEELTKGSSYVSAVNDGYRRSLPPVLDAHITTLLTAIILYSYGLGPVKGFATTQILGLILSLFCGILVSRWVTEWFTNKKKHLEYFTPVSRRIFKHANFKFIEYRKVTYIISFIILALGIGAIFNGFDQGVEFKGGRSYIVRFNEDVTGKMDDIRRDLSQAFGAAPTMKTIGGNNQLEITTSYRIEDHGENVGREVQAKLQEGLARHLPAGLSYEDFEKSHIMGRNTVFPTISEKIKDDAKWATFWSLLVIALYIFIRFRDWRFSLGTIVALLHDVLVTFAVFSFLRNVVPFPLELDQHFIAAILTVIGFSMNDTVIVFDRIREYARKMVGAPQTTIINRAINDTLSRTIMTSLTVFLTLLILFIFGGDVTRGFAFAMLIGVVTGTYSSIFVAAPILVDLGGKKGMMKGSPEDEQNKSKSKPAVAKH